MGAGIVIPWLILLGYEAWAAGYKGGDNPCGEPSTDASKTCGQLPEPYRFLYATAAMGLAGIVAQANERVGVVLAWGLLIGAMIAKYNSGGSAQSKPAIARRGAGPAGTGGGTGPQ